MDYEMSMEKVLEEKFLAELERKEKILGNQDKREEKLEIARGNIQKRFESLEKLQNELKSTVNGKVYLINYFDDLRNQIDIECQLYLCKQELTSYAKEKAIRVQQKMVSEVDRFQTQCLENLKSNPEVELSLAEQNLRSFDIKDTEVFLKLEKDLYTELHNRKKYLFFNRGILFFSTAKYEVFFNLKCDYHEYPQFGVLILIRDEFIIYSEKVTTRLDNFTVVSDRFNELLRLQQIWSVIVSDSQNRPKKSVIVALTLNLNQQKILDLNIDDSNWCPLLKCVSCEMYLRNWTVDLPALTAMDLRNSFLKDLIPSTFCNATNLTNLDLSFNYIQKLHPFVFCPCKNLKQLRLNNNELTSLNNQSFNGLDKLIKLDLSENKLTVLPKGLFKGLTSLQCLDVESNQISTIAEGLFKGLVNLETLDLSSNSIKFLYGNGFFRGLARLNILSLHHNLINKIPEGLFKDLGSLEILDLSANQLDMDQIGLNTFEGLVKLQELRLHKNRITAMSILVFRNISSLRCLFVKENEVKLIKEGFFKDRALRQDKLLCTKCSAAKARNCSKCKSVRYCSKECQEVDWPDHKFFCVPLCLNKDSNKEN